MRLLLFCILLGNIFASDISEYDINGIWEIPEEIEGQSSIGEIFTQGEKAYAYAFDYAKKEADKLIKRDINVEEGDAKNLKGKVFLSNLEFDGKKWVNGKIYNPNNGGIYYAEAYLSPDKNTLTIKATIDSFGLLGRKLVWNRVDSHSFTPLKRTEVIFIDELKNDE